MPRILLFSLILASAVLAGCASAPPPVAEAAPSQLPLVFGAADKLRWQPLQLPGKLRTAFRLDQQAGRACVQAEAVGSASMLRHKLRVGAEQLGQLHFEWQVANLLEGADMTQRETEDSPVRVVLAFDGDRRQFSARNAMLSELTRAVTGEDMPYAMLMYVWSNDLPVGTVITNPRTDRIRKIVVESGPQRLRQWLRYERDIAADFGLAFGEPMGPLQSIAIMTDADNTQGRTQAWYGEIALRPASRP